MKRLGIVVGVVLLVAAIAYPVFGRGPGWGREHPMSGYWFGGPENCWRYDRKSSDLSTEQRDGLEQISREFSRKAETLRGKIWGKYDELHSILNGPEPDAEKAKTLQREINDLRSQLAEHRLNLEIERRKLAPDYRSGGEYAKGYSRRMGGYGPGSGPGSCWN